MRDAGRGLAIRLSAVGVIAEAGAATSGKLVDSVTPGYELPTSVPVMSC
jgi:hypothetical protein